MGVLERWREMGTLLGCKSEEGQLNRGMEMLFGNKNIVISTPQRAADVSVVRPSVEPDAPMGEPFGQSIHLNIGEIHMSEKNKEIVKKVDAAFAAGNPEGFLSFCAEDVKWTMVGEKAVK